MLLILSDFLYPFHSGGVAKHMYYVEKYLASTNDSYRIYTRGDDNTKYPTNEKSFSHENLVLWSDGRVSFVKQLIRDCRGADKIVCHYVTMGLLLVFLKPFLKIEYNFFFHGPIDDEFAVKSGRRVGKWLRAFAQYIVLINSNKVLVHSKFMHNVLISKCRGRDIDVRYIPPFIFPHVNEDCGSDNHKSSSEPYLLISRRLTARSGVLQFLNFLVDNELSEAIPRIVITGDGEEKDEIISLSNRFSFIEFLGHVSENSLRELIQGAAAVVVPSKSLEGLGYIILEAMQYGVPPLVSNLSGGGYDFVNSMFPDLTFELNSPSSFLRSLRAASEVLPETIIASVEAYTFEKMFEETYVQ